MMPMYLARFSYVNALLIVLMLLHFVVLYKLTFSYVLILADSCSSLGSKCVAFLHWLSTLVPVVC